MNRATEKVRIRGLVKVPAAMIGLWGWWAVCKGVYDLAGGEPEANLYAPKPWAFVTQEQWARYSAFELVYGLACLGLAWLMWRYAAKLPEWVERPVPQEEALFK